MAPELQGSLSVIQTLTKECGVAVSMGHTDATFSEGMDGITNGASLITHLFNAMKPFHHREPGLLGVIQKNHKNKQHQQQYIEETNCYTPESTSFSNPFFSIIVDGLHSHPAAVKMAYNLNPKKLVLVTDAMSAMGLGYGTHSLGSISVTIKNENNSNNCNDNKNDNKHKDYDKKATIAGTDILAGSVVSMDTCIRNLKKFTGCSTSDVLATATLHPAQVLKCEKDIGSLRVGSYADLVLLDDDLNVVKTFVNGILVYDKIKQS